MRAQEHLITRIRELCLGDERMVAALTYGSFAQGDADAFSDVEFWFFFRNGDIAAADIPAWLHSIAPARYQTVNEFGSHVVFFPGLIRGEFHFATENDIGSVATWPARSAPVDRMVVLDRTGALARALQALPARPRLPGTADEADQLCGRFANWLLLAHHVARRGETLRAIDALGHARRHLLWMVRLAEGRTDHWLTPSRRAETDLPAQALRQIAATVTAPAAIAEAIAAAWACGSVYWRRLALGMGFEVPEELFAELETALQP